MIGRRAIIGLSLLCALMFSAIAVSTALAESKTTTAYTCVSAEGGAGFSGEHCAANEAVSSGAFYRHAEIEPGSLTYVEATNAKTAEGTTSTNAVLSGTVGGLKATITAKNVLVTSELENFTDPTTKAMDIKQQNVIITLTEAVLSGALATVEGCKLVKGEVETNRLTSTSLVNTMEAEYTHGGAPIAEIRFEGCKTKQLNENPVTLSGTFKAISNGATVETTAASSSGLVFGGQVATFTSKVTPRMLSTILKLTESPISPTTIIDP